MPELVPATMEHALHVAENMRPEEVMEVRLSHNATPHEAVTRCMNISLDQHTVLHEGEPIAITGLYPISRLGSSASPWLLTTPKMADHKFYLVRNTKRLLDKWLDYKPLLYNNVWSGYDASLNWARHTGFTVYPSRPYGVWGAPFNYIQIRRS